MVNDMSFLYQIMRTLLMLKQITKPKSILLQILLNFLQHTQFTAWPPWHPHPSAQCQLPPCWWVASNTRGALCCASILIAGKSRLARRGNDKNNSDAEMQWCEAFSSVLCHWCDALSSVISQCLCFLAQEIMWLSPLAQKKRCLFLFLAQEFM